MELNIDQEATLNNSCNLGDDNNSDIWLQRGLTIGNVKAPFAAELKTNVPIFEEIGDSMVKIRLDTIVTCEKGCCSRSMKLRKMRGNRNAKYQDSVLILKP